MQILNNFLSLSDLVIIVNIGIAIFVAWGEYKRRKAQNKADEGGAVSSIADAAAKVSETSVGLLKVHEGEITQLKAEIVELKNQIKYYRSLLRLNNISFNNFDSRPLTPVKPSEEKSNEEDK